MYSAKTEQAYEQHTHRTATTMINTTTAATAAIMIIFLVSGEMPDGGTGAEPGVEEAFGLGESEGYGVAPDGKGDGVICKKSRWPAVRTYNAGNIAEPHITLAETTPTTIASPLLS